MNLNIERPQGLLEPTSDVTNSAILGMASISLQDVETNSNHLSLYISALRLLKFCTKENSNIPNLEELRQVIAGGGVYIGPESMGGFGGEKPHCLPFILGLKGELIKASRSLFPAVTKLNVLGPDYSFGFSREAKPALPEFDLYFGLDSDWPQELISQKLSWGICLSLWDYAYYLPWGCSVEREIAIYKNVASSLYSNMADKAALIVTTLMSRTPSFEIFMQSFRDANWRTIPIMSENSDPILLIKGF